MNECQARQVTLCLLPTGSRAHFWRKASWGVGNLWIVHPKITILSSFRLTHHQAVPNRYEFFCYAEHKKEDILKNVENQIVDGLFPHTTEIFKRFVAHFVVFCVQQKKDTQTGLEQLE